MKKFFSLLLTLSLLSLPLLAFASCSKSKPTIGIIQFGSHASLNNCYDGVIEGLKENGINLDDYNVEYLNSNFDAGVSLTQANTLVNKNASVIIAIATPSAIAAANAAADHSTPVVYCAVTDSSVMSNYHNITGSSDIPNFPKQLEVVTAFMGKSDLKIGVLYSTEESSSPVQIQNLKLAAQAYDGMQILDSVVADINTIDTKVNDLIEQQVDCMINLLDNTIVGKLESNILPLTNKASIPVFGSEIEQVRVGCAASASIDYIDVGKAAGQSAAAILKGSSSANDIPVSVISTPTNYYNSDVCKNLGLTIPTSLEITDVTKIAK